MNSTYSLILKQFFRILLSCLCTLVLLPTPALSEPDLTPVLTISRHLSLPEDVAFAQEGIICVADGKRDRIAFFSKNGELIRSISVQNPTALAVGNNGNIFVASNHDLSVRILNPTGLSVGFLGNGKGEFKLPQNIAIDRTSGNVYVADQLDNSVKVYSESGEYLYKIGDSLNLPQDIAITGKYIYVLDQPTTGDSFGGVMISARIQVYDHSGAYLHGFGTYGTGEGELVRPKGIASDSQDRIYVSDTYHGVVLCFDENGNYLGAVQDLEDQFKNPMGIAINNGDDSLAVASPATGSVRILSPRAPPPPQPIETIQATVTVATNTVNTKSRGLLIVFIKLPVDTLQEINPKTVALCGVNGSPVDPALKPQLSIKARNRGKNKRFDLKSFFSKRAFRSFDTGQTEMTICGELADGSLFSGSSTLFIKK